MEPSDGQLLDAYREGDLAAFDQLYARHKERLAALALRFCGREADALDVMQDAFVYVVEKRDLVLRGKLTTLLYPVVKNLAIERRRRSSRLVRLEEELPDQAAAEHADLLAGLPDEMRVMVRGLSEIQQEILALRFGDDLPLAEIAESLGVPLGTVKSRLHAALESLRGRRGES